MAAALSAGRPAPKSRPRLPRRRPAGDGVLDTPALPAVRALERYCEDMARREAANFYWGFIAFPASSARRSTRCTTSRVRWMTTPTWTGAAHARIASTSSPPPSRDTARRQHRSGDGPPPDCDAPPCDSARRARHAHRRGCDGPHHYSVPDLGRVAGLCESGGVGCRAACACASSGFATPPPSNGLTSSALPCSSSTSCVTSRKTRRAAASTSQPTS